MAENPSQRNAPTEVIPLNAEYTLVPEGLYRIRMVGGMAISLIACAAFVAVLLSSNPGGRISTGHIVMSFAILISFLTFAFLTFTDLKYKQTGGRDVKGLAIYIVSSILLNVFANLISLLAFREG